MKEIKPKAGRPVSAPKGSVISVRISRVAYDYIMQGAKRERRTLIAALDLMLGV